MDGIDIDEVEKCEAMETICSTAEPHVKKLEHKPLLAHLKYVFLDDDKECNTPIILCFSKHLFNINRRELSKHYLPCDNI